MFTGANRVFDYLRNVYIAYLVLMTSIFIYLTIYNSYIPKVHHFKQVHFVFDAKCANNCSNPHSDVYCNFPLLQGQSYKFVLSLEMPESKVNWEQGMFMININLFSPKQTSLYRATRPAILKQKSRITRYLHALVYGPLLVLGFKNEMQTVEIQLIDNYIEGPVGTASIELVARNLQLYSALLHVYANLSGLSYYMYYWPITSAVLGVITLSSFMGLLSTYRSVSDK